MEDVKNAIEGVLNNPEMMQQIMGMAQAFGFSPEEAPKKEDQEEKPANQAPDLNNLSMLSGMLSGASIDQDQQNLLKALSPYMSSQRIGKLRRAMQAARLAELAGSAMGAAGKGGGQNV